MNTYKFSKAFIDSLSKESMIEKIIDWNLNNPEAFECAGFDVEFEETPEGGVDEKDIKLTLNGETIGLLSELKNILSSFTEDDLRKIMINKYENYI